MEELWSSDSGATNAMTMVARRVLLVVKPLDAFPPRPAIAAPKVHHLNANAFISPVTPVSISLHLLRVLALISSFHHLLVASEVFRRHM
jgi:hypothetical protein